MGGRERPRPGAALTGQRRPWRQRAAPPSTPPAAPICASRTRRDPTSFLHSPQLFAVLGSLVLGHGGGFRKIDFESEFSRLQGLLGAGLAVGTGEQWKSRQRGGEKPARGRKPGERRPTLCALRPWHHAPSSPPLRPTRQPEPNPPSAPKTHDEWCYRNGVWWGPDLALGAPGRHPALSTFLGAVAFFAALTSTPRVCTRAQLRQEQDRILQQIKNL